MDFRTFLRFEIKKKINNNKKNREIELKNQNNKIFLRFSKTPKLFINLLFALCNILELRNLLKIKVGMLMNH